MDLGSYSVHSRSEEDVEEKVFHDHGKVLP